MGRKLLFFCKKCCCEMDGCNRQRQRNHGGLGRWCSNHVPTKLPDGMYQNRFGQHSMDKICDSGRELSQVADVAHA